MCGLKKTGNSGVGVRMAFYVRIAKRQKMITTKRKRDEKSNDPH